MIETSVSIQSPDGVADAMLYRSSDDRRRPGVIHLTDAFGIRESQRAMASRLAELGYVVLLPNIFYRTAPVPVWDFNPVFGDERTMKRFQELSGPLTPEAMERDGAAFVNFLSAHPAVRKGPLGVVGYCMSGRFALRTAAARPAQIAAAASFHGGELFTDKPTSPHLVLPRVRARLYFGHAVEDRTMPPAAIDGLNEALKAWGGSFESEVYDGARHGWTVPDSQAYDERQAGRAFEKLTALFEETLQNPIRPGSD